MKKYLEKFFYLAQFLRYSCLFTFFGKIQNGHQRSKKSHQSSFFKFPITKNYFNSLQFIKVKIEGLWNCLDFFVYICDYKSSKQLAWKKKTSLEWQANQDKHLDGHYISVSWTGTKLGLNMYFLNKQLTYFVKNIKPWMISHLILNQLGQTNIFWHFQPNWAGWIEMSAVCLCPTNKIFCFWSDFDKTLWDCSTHEYYKSFVR